MRPTTKNEPFSDSGARNSLQLKLQKNRTMKIPSPQVGAETFMPDLLPACRGALILKMRDGKK